jgi:hypothetical protein
MRNGHWRGLTPFRHIYNKQGFHSYISEAEDIGITVFFSKRWHYPLFSHGFLGWLCCGRTKKYLNFQMNSDPFESIISGAMFSAQLVIRVDAAEGKTLDGHVWGPTFDLFYHVTSYAVMLMLVWFAVLGLCWVTTGCLLLLSYCPCVNKTKEEAVEFR